MTIAQSLIQILHGSRRLYYSESATHAKASPAYRPPTRYTGLKSAQGDSPNVTITVPVRPFKAPAFAHRKTPFHSVRTSSSAEGGRLVLLIAVSLEYTGLPAASANDMS